MVKNLENEAPLPDLPPGQGGAPITGDPRVRGSQDERDQRRLRATQTPENVAVPDGPRGELSNGKNTPPGICSSPATTDILIKRYLFNGVGATRLPFTPSEKGELEGQKA